MAGALAAPAWRDALVTHIGEILATFGINELPPLAAATLPNQLQDLFNAQGQTADNFSIGVAQHVAGLVVDHAPASIQLNSALQEIQPQIDNIVHGMVADGALNFGQAAQPVVQINEQDLNAADENLDAEMAANPFGEDENEDGQIEVNPVEEEAHEA